MLTVFYINLAHRTDRRAFMERQFAALGIAAERFEAVTPATLDADWRDLAAGPLGRGRVSPPELACSLSHRRLWQIIEERQLPAAVVLEDDMRLAPALARLAAVDWRDDWPIDLLRLETTGRRLLLGRTVAGPLPARQMLAPDPGTGAYVITRAAAQALADRSELAELAVDKFLFGREGPCLYRLKVWHAVPAPCRPEDAEDLEATVRVSDLRQVRSGRRGPRKSRTLRVRLERAGRNLAWSAAAIGSVVRRGALGSLHRLRVPFG